jgi:putative ABC transport system substrate-binding protein
MKRKIIRIAFSAFLFALCFSADAQQPGKVPRIGYLSLRSGFGVNDEAFRQGLRELGYTEGQNIVVEWRFVTVNLSGTMISPLSSFGLKLMPL